MSQIPPPSPTGTNPAVGSDGLPIPRRFWAMGVIWLGLSMAVLDGAIANVALPTLAKALGASPGDAIWIINAYQLAIVVSLLPMAALGDRIGYRRVYLSGLAVFTLASVGCALAADLGQLVIARMAQGLGAAGVMSVGTALVRFTFPQSQLGRGIGYNAVVISVSAALGPTLASAILAVGDWRGLFAINLPFGLLALAIGLRALPATAGSRAPFDTLAAVLNAFTLGGLVLGLEGLTRGEGLPAAALLAVGLAAGAVLVRRERINPAPLVPVDLLAIRPLRAAVITSVLTFTVQMLTFVALPFHFQTVLGRDVVHVGFLMTPWPIAAGLMAPFAGRLADRVNTRYLSALALTLFSIGIAGLAAAPDGSGDLAVIIAMVLCGAGFGLFQAPNNRAIVGSAPRTRSGAAGGLMSISRLLGQTCGAVAMAVIFHSSAVHPTKLALGSAAIMGLLTAAAIGFSARIGEHSAAAST